MYSKKARGLKVSHNTYKQYKNNMNFSENVSVGPPKRKSSVEFGSNLTIGSNLTVGSPTPRRHSSIGLGFGSLNSTSSLISSFSSIDNDKNSQEILRAPLNIISTAFIKRFGE